MSSFLKYLQYDLGAQRDAAGHVVADTSWSAQLQGSEHLWMLLEGTHVVTLMLFAGTIMLVDLRLLGITLRSTPVSKVNDAILPYTIAGFVVMILTGLGLFFASPIEYYYNFIFRLKVAFILAAAINIFVFHYRARANGAAWDSRPGPPATVRTAAAVSLLLWIGVIAAGRYLAYDWFSCETAGETIASMSGCPARDALMAQAEADLVL